MANLFVFGRMCGCLETNKSLILCPSIFLVGCYMTTRLMLTFRRMVNDAGIVVAAALASWFAVGFLRHLLIHARVACA